MPYCSNCGSLLEEGEICSCRQNQQQLHAQQPQPDQYAQPPAPNQYGQPPMDQYGQPQYQYPPSPMNQYQPLPPPNQYGQPQYQYPPMAPMNQYGQPQYQYPQQPAGRYGQYPAMQGQVAPGKSMIRTIGILMTIFGVFALGITIYALDIAYYYLMGILYFELVGTLLILAFGIAGITIAGKREKGGTVVVFGIIIILYRVIDVIWSIVLFSDRRIAVAGTFYLSSIFGLILPILFILGGNMNRKGVQ